MKFSIVVMIVLLMTSCGGADSGIHQHEWTFKIRREGKKVDAHFIKADFRPTKMNVHITGTLNKEAVLMCNLEKPPKDPRNDDSQWSDLDQTKIVLPAGKVDITKKFASYEPAVHFIYIPKDSTIGDLNLNVTIY